MGFFSRNNLTRVKDEGQLINLNDKNAQDHIGFHYLLIEKRLCTLTLFELNILIKTF